MTGCVESAPAVSGTELRRAMGRFATGVTVITSRDRAGAAVGTTANAVASLSLDPPLVLVCLDLTSLTLEAVRGCGAFAVNVLAERQRDLSAMFARRGSDGAWEGVRHEPCATGSPRLADAVATIGCRLEARYPGGDHEIVVGRVVEVHCPEAPDPPLVFHGGTYVTLESLRDS